MSEPFREGAALNSDTIGLNEDDEQSDIKAIANLCNSNEIKMLSSDSDFHDSLSCDKVARICLIGWIHIAWTNNAADGLYGLLRKHGHSTLTIIARTLLGTAKTIQT